MRASGRPPYSHRDPARPVRGGDRSGLSLGALAHRLMALRASLTRRLSGSPAGLPARPSYGVPGRRAEPSWLTAPAASSAARPPSAPRGRRPPRITGRPRSSTTGRASMRWMRRPSRPGSTAAPPRPASWCASPAAPPPSPRSTPRPCAFAAPVFRRPRRCAGPGPPIRYCRSAASAPWRWSASPWSAPARRRRPQPWPRRPSGPHASGSTCAGRPRAAAGRRPRGSSSPPPCRSADAGPDAEIVPLWRQPFVAPPGVRFFRTPDRRPVRPAVELSASTAVIAPVVAAPAIPEAIVPAPARDWSDLPDWSEVQPWFDAGDWSSVDAWAALDPRPPRPCRRPTPPRRRPPPTSASFRCPSTSRTCVRCRRGRSTSSTGSCGSISRRAPPTVRTTAPRPQPSSGPTKRPRSGAPSCRPSRRRPCPPCRWSSAPGVPRPRLRPPRRRVARRSSAPWRRGRRSVREASRAPLRLRPFPSPRRLPTGPRPSGW